MAEGNSTAIIKAVVTDATASALDKYAPGLTEQQKRLIVDTATVKAGPVIKNQTNDEPWYQSRVTLSAILAIVSGLLAAFGYALPDELQGQLLEIAVAAGPVIAGVGAIYGRWFAKKPLGQ